MEWRNERKWVRKINGMRKLMDVGEKCHAHLEGDVLQDECVLAAT